MSTKIKFVRYYKSYGTEFVDIVYDTNRCRTVEADKMPRTAKDFIVTSKKKAVSYDRTFKRDEIVYSN